MVVGCSREQLRAHLDALAMDLADEWEPAALYAVLAEEASLAASEALIKERICADASGLGVGRNGRPTRAGRRLCQQLRVLQFDRAELPDGRAQIRTQVAFGEVRVSWTCLVEPDRAVLTICATHDAGGPPARLLQMHTTREVGSERGHCSLQLRPRELERLDMELGLELGCTALLQLLVRMPRFASLRVRPAGRDRVGG